MRYAITCLLALSTATAAAAALPPGTDPADRLLQLGLLDVTKAPYSADPTGTRDSTQAIQRAINDARDGGLVCFFPSGTYLISDTLSCEQQVKKLDAPRFTDGKRQSYWDLSHRIVIFGSTKGKRPVLRLAPGAAGFDNPAKPKLAVWVWAQTRDDAPGKEEPEWGKEQPNISFGHVFKGVDIDVRGHAGAIGIRHSGSQGSMLQDSTIYAEGAYAGMNNCCGQGGGTYNIEVVGGEYGIVIEPQSRFPILTSCVFRGQTKAAIRYSQGGSQVPTLLVGCRLEPAGDAAVDMTTERSYAGVNMVECVVAMKPGGTIVKTRGKENVYLEDSYVQGAQAVCTGGAAMPTAAGWARVARYSSHSDQGVNLVNGVESRGEVTQWEPVAAAPAYEEIRARHYSPGPSFEDADAANVKEFGAKGDGTTNDTAAFERAIAARDKVFVPKGNYQLSGTLRLRPNTQLFGLTRSYSVIGSGDAGGRRGRGAGDADSFTVATVDDADAAPGLWFLSIRGRVEWQSGRGTWMLTSAPLRISGHGGGKLYAIMAMGRQFLLQGVSQPTSFYALNVERVGTNPQSEIRDSAHIRIYYFKVESGTVNAPNAGDANTPCRISGSQDIRVYCMYGNVKKLVDRPMLDVADSTGIVVSQLKAFQPAGFPHITESVGGQKVEVPSSRTCALYVRDAEP